jgi:hypothetical protein
MKKNAQTIAIIRFMSGPWGRGGRFLGGIVLWSFAIMDGGGAYLLAIPGTLMLVTGVMNYCPAGLVLKKPTDRSEFMASLKPVNLLKS